MKAVLVMEMPETCSQCDLCYDCIDCMRRPGDIPYDIEKFAKIFTDARMPWCPLRPLPEKRNTTSLIETKHEAEENHVTPQHQAGFNLGWNACLEAITGEAEK